MSREDWGLTPAEEAVTRALCDGKRYSEIALERGTSDKTVKYQAGCAMRKAGARTLAQLTALWAVGYDEGR